MGRTNNRRRYANIRELLLKQTDVKMPPFVKDEPGVYALSHPVSGIYIGCSKTILTRLYSHLGLLKRNKHPNKKLQSAWSIANGKNFEFCVLSVTADYYQAEHRWISDFDSYRNGLNNTSGGERGFEAHTPEVRERLSKTKQGDLNPAKKSGALISAGLKGRKLTEEHRKNISLGGKGKQAGDLNPAKRPEVRAKISASQKGKIRGPRPKQAQALQGRFAMNNGTITRVVHPEEAASLAAQGWVRGRKK